MQISPINSSLVSSKNSSQNNLRSNNLGVSFGTKKKENLKNLSGAVMLATAVAGAPLASGCSAFDIDETHNIYAKIPVDRDTTYIPIPMDPDTFYVHVRDTVPYEVHDTINVHDSIPVPYIVRDTIQQIITQKDTVFMKPEYDSPVAPVIKKFFWELNIDPGKGKIPVKMHWTDEKENAFYQAKFIGDNSSYNEMTFLITKTPFDEKEGGFVIGKNDSYGRVKFSKISDNQLSIDYEKPINKGKPSMDRNDLWVPFESYVNDIRTGKVGHYIWNKLNQTADKKGDYWPGDMPSSIIFNNLYGDKYRLSSLSVKSTDAPSTEK